MRAGDQRADARPADDVDVDAFLGERAEHPDVRESPGAASAQHHAHGAPADASREPVDVAIALEERVIQRTHQLERRTMQLQAAADIARDIAQNRDLNALLVQTVAQIHDRFGFYPAGIFLIDATDGMLVLRAANSREGAQMLSQGYRLSVDESTLIGDVAKMGRSRLASYTTTTPILFMSPLLPETRSEVALPLAVLGDKGEKAIIGVLDVHSVEPDAFDEQEVTALQILADQLAAAVANVRLFNEYQQNLHELGKVYNRFRQDAWTLYIRNQQLAGYELTSAPVIASPVMPVRRTEKGGTIAQLGWTEMQWPDPYRSGQRQIETLMKRSREAGGPI